MYLWNKEEMLTEVVFYENMQELSVGCQSASKIHVKQFQAMMQSPSKSIEFFPITPVDSGLNLPVMGMNLFEETVPQTSTTAGVPRLEID